MAKNRRKESDCCSVTFLKYVLHMFNILFVAAGLSVLAVGVWSVVDNETFVALLTSVTYSLTAYVLVAAGCLVLVVAVVGCVAVYKEQRCLLLLYTFLLLLIFVLEAMAGFLAFVYQEQVETELKMNLNNTFLEYYHVDGAKTQAIDHFQKEFKCCGALRFEDWRYSKWYKEHRNQQSLVPDSCCKSPSPNCGVRDHPSNIQYDGCMLALADVAKEHLTIISAVGTGICVLQIFGIIFSSCLYIKLKNKDDIRP